MSALLNQLGSFIQYLFDQIQEVILFVTDLLTWLTTAIAGIVSMIGSICPNEIALVITPVLVSMFAFLGIKLLVRLL